MNVINTMQPMKPGIGSIRAELLKELSETEIERLEFRWKQALEDAHGEWPDPTVSEDKRNEWLSRVTKVLYKFFLRSGLQQEDSRRTRIDDVRRICVARQKFSLEDVLEYAKIELQLHKEGKSRTLNDVLENDMAVKQNPKPPKQVAPGTLVNADIEAKANDAAEKALNHNREVMALRLAWQAIEDGKKYQRIDPGNLRDQIRARYGVKNDDDLVDHADYERPILEAAFASAIDEWQANEQLKKSSSPDEAKSDVGPIDELGDYLQRRANGAPNPDPKYTPPAEPEENEWAAFWKSAKFQVDRLERGYDAHQYVHDFYGVKSAKDIDKNKGQILTEIKDHIDHILDARQEEARIEAEETTQKKQPEPPTQPKIDNAPISHQEAPILNDTPKSEVKTDAPKIEANLTANSNGHEKAIAIVPPAPIEITRWDIMRQQATVMIKSGFLPQSIRTPEQALTIMMMGDALGIQPIVALNNINVIQGKPTVSPQLQLALIRRSGQLENFKVTDDGETCTVVIKRKNEPEHTETFSQKDAAAMGLANKDNWRKQPATMRRWRAISAACRLIFPDISWGIASYISEEIDPDYNVIEAA